MKIDKNLVIGILVAIVAGGAGFFGGIQFRNHQLTGARMNFANGTFQRGVTGRMGMGRGMGGGVLGSVISQDDKSITVKMMDGSTKIILLSDSTTYSNTIPATKTDVKVGTNVAVFGATNSDGSVTATNVQLRTPSSK